jgi:hypothetical protein
MPGFRVNWEWWRGRPSLKSRAKREITMATSSWLFVQNEL